MMITNDFHLLIQYLCYKFWIRAYILIMVCYYWQIRVRLGKTFHCVQMCFNEFHSCNKFIKQDFCFVSFFDVLLLSF